MGQAMWNVEDSFQVLGYYTVYTGYILSVVEIKKERATNNKQN